MEACHSAKARRRIATLRAFMMRSASLVDGICRKRCHIRQAFRRLRQSNWALEVGNEPETEQGQVSLSSRAVPSLSRSTSLLLAATFAGDAKADQAQIERGRYLTQIAGCSDCHTPGHFLGNPDMSRFLGGSDVGFEVPGVGIVYGPNLTPDDARPALAPGAPTRSLRQSGPA
jgi:mono/diheme cytochrome c family protein